VVVELELEDEDDDEEDDEDEDDDVDDEVVVEVEVVVGVPGQRPHSTQVSQLPLHAWAAGAVTNAVDDIRPAMTSTTIARFFKRTFADIVRRYRMHRRASAIPLGGARQTAPRGPPTAWCG
jgi:hypothetical protein